MTDLFENLKRLPRGPRRRRGAHRTIATAREHLSFQKADHWTGYWRMRRALVQPRSSFLLPACEALCPVVDLPATVRELAKAA